HEKPFAGINGSGKHLNYSLGSAQAGNMFDPGDTPANNAQFLVICCAMVKAVYKNAKLLRATVASASNDHRLGANEAPPAIISIFLGTELNSIFEAIASGKSIKTKKGIMHVGVDVLPPIPKHSGDRNRTSPMAFTGNRFEFRAVGANQSIAGPSVALNVILTQQLDEAASFLEKADTSTPKKLGTAVEKYIKSVWNECSNVVFNGDGYAQSWHKEAAKRGLPNLRTTPEALPELKSKEVVSLFSKYKVLSKRELISRYEVYTEQYIMSVLVEANTVVEMTRTQIFPAAVRYQCELAGTLTNLMALGHEPDQKTLTLITNLIAVLQDSVADLVTLLEVHHKNVQAEAEYLCNNVLPQMLVVREAVDILEGYVADDLWPQPTYQDILYIK
ncbi:MAG: hypothetical protein JKX85_06510, partial [Phycisphaeraceae bacterium]|nr:hypothetical protein [Phycisphaeraceae bacterium]